MNRPLASKLAVPLLLLALSAGVAGAREQQLAGMRLNQHAINLLDVYGQPDGIVVGSGPEIGAPSAAQTAPGAPLMGGPSPQMGAPAAGMGMAGGVGAPPAPGAPGAPGPGAFPGAPAAGAPGAPGAPGAAGAAGAAGAGVQVSPFPVWALAVWVDMAPDQVEWIYNKGPVVLGFVLDRDGYINSITVAGEDCDYARTALWRPHQYVKLGDDFKRVLYRYGWPDEWVTFDSTGPGDAAPGQGSLSVSFSTSSRVFSRDVELHYQEHNNVAFTLHNMLVTRIMIWK